MIVEDYTLDKNFSELKEGTCFVWYSHYYMKIRINLYDDYSNKTDIDYSHAVNLESGFTEKIKDDEKVRVVTGRVIIE